MTAAYVLTAAAALAVCGWLALRARRRHPETAPAPAPVYADAPALLGEAKGRFEHANARLLAAQEAWHSAAAEVDAAGKEMTAAYQAWATGRAATALEQNGGRMASVFDRLEHADELLARPVPRTEP
jgi:hypothetical protein